ncbi:type II toxin-antitoxin system PemK/MazF family toxin [Paenibacillus sp. BR2-3]|uniref:type II toxin-antitoxin system PemK/MazF family toxin n=1 Tax=Paenibacillus sp. BR2-3 TaxID=3048494 RepID=UPI00397777CE
MPKNLVVGDVWYAKFPLEEDSSKYIERPAIIADVHLPDVAIIKVTKHDPRENDQYDTIIVHYNQAKLKRQSTARVSKLVTVDISQILNRKGTLHPEDFKNVFEQLDKFIDEE